MPVIHSHLLKTNLKKNWFTAEELDETRTDQEHETEQNEEIEEQDDGHNGRLKRNRDETSMMKVPSEINQDDKELIEVIHTKRESLEEHRAGLRSLKHVEKKLMEEVTKLDRVLPKVEIRNITELNDTILACAIIVTEKFETQKSKRQSNQEPGWKERLRRKVENLRGDVSRVVECRKRTCEDGMRKRLEEKYKIRTKGFDVVIEELKQDTKTKTQKIKRFSERNKQYRENRMFVNNQRQFFVRILGTNATKSK